MKLEGVVGACELADIFHLLSSTARSGVLVVSKSGVRRKLYFGPEGVTLFFDSSRSSRLLGQILLGRGILSEKVLESALAKQRATGRPLGQILCNSGAARPEQVEEALAYQLREELFHLLTWENAHFEFHEGAQHPIDPGRSYSRTPSFNTDAILMEAARRADEWQRIRQVIPSEHAAPLRTSGDAALTGELVDNEVASALLELADGTLSVHEMVETLRRSEFDVYECTCALLEAGMVKLANAKELADLAAAALEVPDTDRARKLLLKGAACCGDDLELRYDIGTMFFWAGDEAGGRTNLDIILRHLVDEGLTAQIDQMLDQIRDEFPDVPYSYERRLKLLSPRTDFHQALALAVHLLDLYDARQDTQTARNMLRHLSAFTVTKSEDLLRLAEMLECHDCRIAAARKYHLAANQLRYAGRRGEAIHFYRKALSLDDKLAPARGELDYLLSRPRRRRRRLALAAVAALTILAVLAAASFLLHREEVAREDFDSVTALVGDLLSRKDFDGAREAYAGLLNDHPYTTVLSEVRERIGQIERQRQEHLKTMRQAELRLSASAERAERELDLDRAVADYRSLAEMALTDGLAEKARAHVRRLDAEKDSYAKLLDEGCIHETARRYPQALRSYLAARKRSRRLFDRDGVKLPLLLESEPPGAAVLAGGKVLGTTPLLLHRDVGKPVSLTLRGTGFYDTPLELPAQSTHAVARVELVRTRRPLWTFRGEGAIDETPAIVGTTCYVATRQGRLYALSLETGRPLWKRRLKGMSGAYLSRALVVRERLLLTTMDGSLLAFARGTGKELWRREGHGLLVGPPSYLASEKFVVLLYPNGTAQCVDSAQGATVTRLTMPGPIRGSALVAGDMLFYGTADYAVQAFDLKRRTATWKWRAGRAVTQEMKCSGRILYVPLQDMGVAAISLDGGRRLWRFSDAGTQITTLATNGSYVFVTGRDDRLTALHARSGRLVWQVVLDGRATVAPGADSQQVYVGTADGKLSVFRVSDGRLLWKTDLAGPLAAPPMVLGNHVLVTTANGAVQAFER